MKIKLRALKDENIHNQTQVWIDKEPICIIDGTPTTLSLFIKDLLKLLNHNDIEVEVVK